MHAPLRRNSVGAQPTRPTHIHWNSAQFHDDSEHYELHVGHIMVSIIFSAIKLSRALFFDSCSPICEVFSDPAIHLEI